MHFTNRLRNLKLEELFASMWTTVRIRKYSYFPVFIIIYIHININHVHNIWDEREKERRKS